VNERVQSLLELADDELVVGWRDSEWTGIAPTLEEDVAFSSIAQNEIGHARAAYELAAAELGTDADALAFDRKPAEYRCAPLVELRLLDWAHTIARRWLYEQADRVRIEALMRSDNAELASLAAKIDREETYHRIHAELWADRLRDEPRFREAVDELWPYALGVLPESQRPLLCERLERASDESSLAQERGTHRPELAQRLERAASDESSLAQERGTHTRELAELWGEMTSVRRSVPGARW
jgi:ring-1,2-phenylacetyl-CoA epoxidase subunit PaaC